MGSAAATVRTRAVQLRGIVRELFALGIVAPRELNPVAIESLLGRLQTRLTRSGARVDRSTVAKDVGALRAFLRWLQRRGHVAEDLWSELPSIRIPDRPPIATLSVNEVERVLVAVPRRSAIGMRNHAMLELMYSSGLRRAEVCALDVCDFAGEEGLVRIRRGKGGRSRVVPVGKRAVAAVMTYVATSRIGCLKSVDEPALFLGRHGGRLTPKTLTALCQARLHAAGIRGRGSCHVFRHTMATLMHDAGADIRDLQVLLGHTRLTTTQIYTQVSVARLQKVHQLTHPAG